MRTLLVVESKHCGNTRRLAEAMAAAVPDTLVTDTKGVQAYDLNAFDLVGFGSGIYQGGFDRRIVKLIESFSDMPAKAFVFSSWAILPARAWTSFLCCASWAGSTRAAPPRRTCRTAQTFYAASSLPSADEGGLDR